MLRALLISMFLTSTALATTWTVNDDGKADFDNIQTAIDAASNGDEILVAPGTYTNSGSSFVIFFAGKTLTIRATGTPEETILDGQNERGVVVFAGGEGPDTLIEGFTIKRGYDYSGAGIACPSNANPTISNCLITNNTAIQSGGGIRCDGILTITDCTISDNNASIGGGGIYCLGNDAAATITDCIISMNSVSDDTSVYGGGIYALYSDDITISNSTISENTATSHNNSAYGGGIYFRESSNATLANCILTENNASGGTPSFGGGMYCQTNSNPTITECAILDNNADNGGGIYSSGSNPMLMHSQVCGNEQGDQIQGSWTNGGNTCVSEICIACDSILEVPSEYATIQSAIDAAADGDTVLVAPGTYTGSLGTAYVFHTLGKAITIQASGSPEETILDGENSRRVVLHSGAENVVTVIDGFTITRGFTENSYGGGFASTSSSTSPTITDCIITGNTSNSRGGGLYFASSNSPTITNCTISNNTTNSEFSNGGGGMYFENFCDVIISNCTITGNTSGFDGGGIYCTYVESTTITNSIISGNTANHDGGAMYGYYMDSMLSGCTIEDNNAGNEGGAIYYHFSTATLSNCIISGNNAHSSGGGIFCNGNEIYNPILIQSDVCGNTPDQFVGPWTDGGSVCTTSTCEVCFALHVPSEHLTIQGAIDVAENGDTILVAPGTYTSNGERVIDTLGKAITIRATGSSEETILDGEFERGVVQCINGEDSNTVIEGFTITRGIALMGFGGGMRNFNSSPTITHCIFTSNTADYGGGMDNDNSSPTLTTCTFENNTANFGGGMSNYYKSSPMLSNCIFTNNSAGDGGGMYHYSSNATLIDTVVCGNTPSQIYGDWTDNGGNTITEICPMDCISDIDVDGNVDIQDLLILIAGWGTCTDNCSGDVNDDGEVNVNDLLILISAWGECG